MNKATSLFSFLILFVCLHNLSAQKCAFDRLQEKLIEDQPNYLQELRELEEQVSEAQMMGTSRSANSYTIPVVFHVIHKGESIGQGSNISEARILSQLEILNEDFSRSNVDAGNTPANFASVAANTNIQFCIASIDPSGSPTNGITRHQYNNISNLEYIENNIKPSTTWAPQKYLNVWIVTMPEQGILGYSYKPTSTMVGSDRDGLVVDHDHFGYISNTNKGRTATHEIGHYLGLDHMWGGNSGGSPIGCSSDDGIADTPNSSGPYYNCPSFGLSSCNSVDMHMNYMDYTNDNCMNMFSEGQASVMQSVLANQRAVLVANANTACNVECVNLSTNDLEMDFEPSQNTNGWVIENSNNDNYSWSMGSFSTNDYGPSSGEGLAIYRWNTNEAADDYLFTPCFFIKAHEIYELEFSYACARDNNQLYEEAFEVGFSFAQNSSDFQVPSADWRFDPVTNAYDKDDPAGSYNTQILRFYNTSDATLSLGFHVFSPKDRYAMQIDDISLRYTGLTDTKEVVQIDNITVFPNPTEGDLMVNLEFSEVKDEVQVILQDVTGRVLQSQYLSNVSQENVAFDMANLAQGLYLVTINDGLSSVTKKVTKL